MLMNRPGLSILLATLTACLGACDPDDEFVADEVVADEWIDDDRGAAHGLGRAGLSSGPPVALGACKASPGHYPYLDGECNGGRVKTYPGKVGSNAQFRGWTCPNRGSIPAGYLPALTSLGAVRNHVDTQALAALGLPSGLSAAVINVRRDAAGRPYYRYFGTTNHLEARESWSASKFMAVAAAGARIREESSNMLGLSSRTGSGEALGDLVTWVHNYSQGGSYASNALARYFLDVAGRDFARGLVRTWIGATEGSLGANYGPFYPDGISYSFVEGDSSRTVRHDGEAGGDKNLSVLSAAEFLKRLVMHREDGATRLPGFRGESDAAAVWKDLQVLFYGKAGWYWGGMQDDTAIYIESALDMPAIEARAPGQWRIFSKLGYGISDSRQRHEFVYVGYACLPDLDQPAVGKEFVVAFHYSKPIATDGTWMDASLAGATETIVQKIMSGQLDGLAAKPSQAPLRDLVGHWAEQPSRGLVQAGVLAGYQDGTFLPDRELTRAEFATMIAGAFPVPVKASCADRSFSDIQGHWARDAILAVAHACFMSGGIDGTFRPNDRITRTEVLVTLSSGLGLKDGAESMLQKYRDRGKIPAWARAAVANAVAAGIVPVFPYADRLEPNAFATRAEAAVAIARAGK